MRRRETVVQWNTMKEGDQFLRYTQEGAVKMLVVLREAPDLPQEKGAMGYAVVQHNGFTTSDVLVIRRRTGQGAALMPWVAPLLPGPEGHFLNEDNIVEFRPVTLVNQVLPGDLRDIVRDILDRAAVADRASVVESFERRLLGLLTGL